MISTSLTTRWQLPSSSLYVWKWLPGGRSWGWRSPDSPRIQYGEDSNIIHHLFSKYWTTVFFPIVARDTWIYMVCSVPSLYHVFSYLLCYFRDIICAPLTLLSHTFILPISHEINLTQYKLHSFCLCTSIHTAERSCKATHHWTQLQFCASIATVLQCTEMLH